VTERETLTLTKIRGLTRALELAAPGTRSSESDLIRSDLTQENLATLASWQLTLVSAQSVGTQCASAEREKALLAAEGFSENATTVRPEVWPKPRQMTLLEEHEQRVSLRP
jgi:hypothetical protein